MPARGCPLPNTQPPRKCKDCPLPEVERIQQCNWYRGTLHGLKPSRLNTVSNGVLLFSFSIIVLSQPSLTNEQKYIAFGSLIISGILAICALLPSDVVWLSNGWVYAGISAFTLLTWFFTFALEWLNGITDVKNFEREVISVLGILWLFVSFMLLTRGLTLAINRRKSLMWLPLMVPIVLLWRTVVIFLDGNWIAGIVLAAFVVGSTAIALMIWKPAGELLT
jgi:hypothetical protein